MAAALLLLTLNETGLLSPVEEALSFVISLGIDAKRGRVNRQNLLTLSMGEP